LKKALYSYHWGEGHYVVYDDGSEEAIATPPQPAEPYPESTPVLDAKATSSSQAKFYLSPDCDCDTFLALLFYMVRENRSMSFNFTADQWARLPEDFKKALKRG
jgi:hypothetical protein